MILLSSLLRFATIPLCLLLVFISLIVPSSNATMSSLPHSLASHQFPNAMKECVARIQKILDQTKNPVAPEDVDHQYDDKYALVENVVNTGIAAVLNVLEELEGFHHEETLKQVLVMVHEQKRSMTLRFTVEEDCTFLEETTRQVESPTKQQVTVSSSQGEVDQSNDTNATTVYTHKTVTEVREYHWKVGMRHALTLFAGTDPSKGIVLGTRTGTTQLVTKMKKHPYPPQTRSPMDLDLTFVLNQIDKDSLVASFRIDRDAAKTPRRNAQTKQALEFANHLLQWSNRCAGYFQRTAWKELLAGKQDSYAEGLRKISSTDVFVPIVPLFMGGGSEVNDSGTDADQTERRNGLVLLPETSAPQIPLQDTTKFLLEQKRSLKEMIMKVTADFPDASQGQEIVSGYEAEQVLLWKHLASLAQAWSFGIDYVEYMLYSQLEAAIGKKVKAKDFDEFLAYHNQRLVGNKFTPKPFCYSIRQPNSFPDGMLSIVSKNHRNYRHGGFGGYGSPGDEQDEDNIATFCQHVPGDALMVPIEIPLNAATTIDFVGDLFLHGWVDTQFQGEEQAQHYISARARQFSCFMMVLGTMSGPHQFTPTDAILLQNKDEVLIPLLTAALPSAKEFRDAIQSLSPEQARFAKAYRAMQLGSSVFGICVIQIKPQMEALLKLPDNALLKEMQLTTDLLSLFADYQVPPTLMSYDGPESATMPEKVAAIKQHVQGVMDVIKNIKGEQLEEETRKAVMRKQIIEQQKEHSSASPFGSALAKERLIRASAAPAFGSAPVPRSTEQNLAEEMAPAWDWMGSADLPDAADLDGGVRATDVLRPGDGSVGRSRGSMIAEQNQAREMANALDWLRSSDAPKSGTSTPRPSMERDDDEKDTDSVNFDALEGDDFDELQDQFSELVVQGKETFVVPDVTALPKKLDRIFEVFDKDGALRTMTLKTGNVWTRKRQDNLLTKSKTTELSGADKQTETNKALDLLDALSRSGSLPIASGEMHVVIGVRHAFAQNVMATVLEENVNPIDKVDYTSLLLGCAVHQVDVMTLVADAAEPPKAILQSRAFPPLMMKNRATLSGDDANAAASQT